MDTAETIIAVARWYLVAGGGVALIFLTYAVGRIDPAARDSYLFRILLIPGVVGLWPLVLWAWRRRAGAG